MPADAASVMRQAFAGLLWSKQLYAYDGPLAPGDRPARPRARRHGRNARWATDVRHHVDARQMESPWFAAWDMAFHCVALAHVDPAFAKYQLILLCREWFQHPNGALPATSGTSATSTHRSRRGPPSRSSPSTRP